MTFGRNRFISIILIVILVFSSTVTAFADDDAAQDKEDQKKQEEQLKAKKEAEKKAAEEKARKEAEAKAAEEKARQEAEKKAAEEKAKQEAEEKAAEEKARQEAEAKAAEEKQEKTEVSEDKETPQAEQSSADSDSSNVRSDKKDSKKTTEDSKEDNGLKLQSELSDGTYKPEATFTGGSNRVHFTCDQVIIKDGAATAVIKVDTDNVTHLYMNAVSSRAENNSLYDPKTGAIGKDVYTFLDRHISVPVKLNTSEGVDFSGRTNAMSPASRWISYKYTLLVKDESQKVSDDTTIPENGTSQPEEEADPEEPEEPDDSKDKTKLKDGTYKVKATTDRKMFYLYPKKKNPATTILVKKNGKMTATITLTGSGYDYVYMGTPKQAKKAGKKKWIKYKKVNGYYTFKIPVSALDKKLPITPHSSKYEKDGDPSTDPWRPNKWIKFYSSGAKKVKAGTSIKTKGKASNRNNGNNGKQVKWADGNKGTSAVNNSTSLKDGTYKPDKFRWSGGSGRLSYIRCTKIVVRGGKAYATIEFGSSKYDSLKASGRTYSRSGGGNSKFTIPVKLNANNTIIGRTTAMSQAHWVRYSIYIYKKGAGAGKSGSEEGDDGHVTSTKKLSSKAPDLMGLEFKEEVEVKYAEYFKIFKYEQGIILIEIDQASDTALYKEEKKEDKKKSAEGGEEAETEDDLGHVEYDDEGNIIAQSQNEVVDGLYQNNVVNYIVVPEGVELPAGLDKDGIILQQPIEKSFLASEKAADALEQLGLLDKVTTIGFDAEKDGSDELKKALEAESMTAAGTAEKPDYAALVKAKADMGIFPSMVLPEKLDKEASEDEKTEADEKTENIGVLRKRFAALGTPMMIDRSDDEKTNYASAEWIKVYGAVFGKDQEAGIIFDKYVADNKKENNEQ